MPDTLDFPRTRTPRSSRRFLILLIPLAFLALLSSGTLLSFYVDNLWFSSLGYSEVFWKTLRLEWELFAAVLFLTFLVLYAASLLFRRIHGYDLTGSRTVTFNRQSITLSVEPLLRWLALAFAAAVAFITALSLSSDWPVLARFWSARHLPATTFDPLLGKSLDFYLFTLPVLRLAADWLTTLAVFTLGTAIFLLFLASGSRALEGRAAFTARASWRGVSLATAFFFLAIAFQVYLSRFEQLLGEHTIFSGANYIDAHVALRGLLFVAFALLLGAAISLANAASPQSSRRRLVFAALPAAFTYAALLLISAYVNNFSVKPNELVRERPYIGYNIEFTRKAYGLDRMAQREFSAQTTVESADAPNNQATLRNIRLWDWHALQDTLRQIQEIRTYYDFPDIDVDRYDFAGTTHQVMIAARELNTEKLPESSRNWINEKLIYTHGYGLTMNPVNGFTPEGLPNLILGNMPVVSTVPGLTITRPEIYFGEVTNTDVYVKTGQQEFNYPQGQTNSLTSYTGTGGIPIGGRIRRLLLAVARGDLAKLPFSDDVHPDSRLLMRRNVIARASALAPFLTFDPDPYIVVGDDGRLSWIIDAFTTSPNFPYSRHTTFAGDDINYVRNSVKVVVDAYDGTTTFFVFDPEDPILASYRNLFPTLFRDGSSMPQDLRRHVRYSELLLRLQAEVYGLYHMTDPEMFYNREDLWTPASESGVDDQGQRSTQPIAPNFVLMKLPGESAAEFVNILPFTPANRNNLIGWMAGRSDGPNFGTAVVYNFPKTKLIDGPLQVEARIDQNAELSGQLTLWNQQGSHVRRGNLLVIPTGNALLYAEPIYLQAERSPMPELRLVVLALQDRLAYGPTFESAMASLFAGAPSSATASQSGNQSQTQSVSTQLSAAGGSTAAPAATCSANIKEAAGALSDYQRLTSEGKLAAAGAKLEALKHSLDALAACPK